MNAQITTCQATWKIDVVRHVSLPSVLLAQFSQDSVAARNVELIIKFQVTRDHVSSYKDADRISTKTEWVNAKLALPIPE